MVAMIMMINISFNLPYYKDKNNYNELMDAIRIIEKHEIPMVCVFGDDLIIDARNLRVLDLTKIYKQVNSKMKIFHWGDTLRYDDMGEYSGEVLILTTKDSLKKLPEYVVDPAEEVDKTGKYILLKIDENILDFVSADGYGNEINKDIIYSPGIYIKDDDANQNDNIIENKKDEGRYVMYGPYKEIEKGTYDLILNYELHGDTENSLFNVAIGKGTKVLGSEVFE